MKIGLAGLFGVIFGCGILLSGMGNPAKVLNFFDFAGRWDPSLAFVMGGALLVTMIGYRLVLPRGAPLLEASFALPTNTKLDAPLLGGSALFGVGWGITGFCPGGVVPMIASGHAGPVIFVGGLIAGIIAASVVRGMMTAPAKPVAV